MKKICEICGGAGQISFFQGVSRFLLTWDECPACHGVGYKISSAEQVPDTAKHENKPGRKKKSV